MHKAASASRTYVLADMKCTNEWVSEWASDRVNGWIANKSRMLRKRRASKTRWLSFPAHVHGVSAMVFARPITIPTLCKSIIERETYDHFSSVCVACALDPLILSRCSYLLPFAFLLSSFPRLSLSATHNYTLEQHTLPRAINAHFVRVISFRIRFSLVVHSCVYSSPCQSEISVLVRLLFPWRLHRLDYDPKRFIFPLSLLSHSCWSRRNRFLRSLFLLQLARRVHVLGTINWM